MTQYRYNMKNENNEFDNDEDNFNVNPNINSNVNPTPYIAGRSLNNKPADRKMKAKASKAETLFYKYRWWIVIILACLLLYFLYARKCEEGSDDSVQNVRWIDPQLTNSFDNIGQIYNDPHNTDIRRLFKF